MSFLKSVEANIGSGKPLNYWDSANKPAQVTKTEPVTATPPPPIQKRDTKPDPDMKANENVRQLVINFEQLLERFKGIDDMDEHTLKQFLTDVQITSTQTGYAFVAWPDAEKMADLRHAFATLTRDMSVWSTFRLISMGKCLGEMRDFKKYADSKIKELETKNEDQPQVNNALSKRLDDIEAALTKPQGKK